MNDALWRLEKATFNFDAVEAKWVLYAVSRHVLTGRATREFEQTLNTYSEKDFIKLIDYCLCKRDLSDDGIMKSVKTYMKRKAA